MTVKIGQFLFMMGVNIFGSITLSFLFPNITGFCYSMAFAIFLVGIGQYFNSVMLLILVLHSYGVI